MIAASATGAESGAFDPDPQTVTEWLDATRRYITTFIDGLDDAPAIGPDLPVNLAGRFAVPPPDEPGRFEVLVDTFAEAARYATETAGPRHFAYVPGGGLVSSAIAESLARVANRYTALATVAPGLVAMEQGVLRWLCTEFGLPPSATGLVTTGASMATLGVVAAVRHDRLGEEFGDGTIYITEHTHRSMAKAARVAGIRPERLRIVPVAPDLRMDVVAAARMIAADRAAGLRPFLLVGTAGTTSTGAVDPLLELAALAREEDLWLHVDAAYGGFFQLTQRGRDRLTGIESADSIALDPHKGLFLPHGTGVLLVRDPEPLRAVFGEEGPYLQDIGAAGMLPNFADLGVELTREFRGLRLWLPLHLHGVTAFRDALDEKLDLAAYAHDELVRMKGVHVPWRPDLSTVTFRHAAGDNATQRLLERVHDSKKVLLSSTRVGGHSMLRMCVLSHRTRVEHVDDALEVIRDAAQRVPSSRPA